MRPIFKESWGGGRRSSGSFIKDATEIGGGEDISTGDGGTQV